MTMAALVMSVVSDIAGFQIKSSVRGFWALFLANVPNRPCTVKFLDIS